MAQYLDRQRLAIAKAVPPGGQGWCACGKDRWMGDDVSAAECTSMAEVRAGVDQVDCELVTLLRRRFDYMDAAARIKPERGQVRDEARKSEVIENACSRARALGIPDGPIAALWETLVEASITYELEAFDRR